MLYTDFGLTRPGMKPSSSLPTLTASTSAMPAYGLDKRCYSLLIKAMFPEQAAVTCQGCQMDRPPLQ